MNDIRPPKPAVMLALLERGVVQVHYNPKSTRCSTPPHLRDDDSVRIDIAYHFPEGVQIPDLVIDAEGVSGTLTFGSNGSYRCAIHWSAVYALLDESGTRGMVWAEDVPEALKEQEGEARPKPDEESNVISVDFKHRRKN